MEAPVRPPWSTLLGLGPAGWVIEMVIGFTFIIAGLALLVQGWRAVYRARRADRLLTSGMYGVVRHPQYAGVVVALFGQLIHWPTIPTLALYPVIVWAYVRLARKEETELEARFGEAYRAYRRRVPMLIPEWREWRRLLGRGQRRPRDGQQDASGGQWDWRSRYSTAVPRRASPPRPIMAMVSLAGIYVRRRC